MGFEDFLGEWIKWGLAIGFVYLCYINPIARMIGYFIASLLILAVTVRTFITIGIWTPSATSDLVTALVIFGSCVIGHINQEDN